MGDYIPQLNKFCFPGEANNLATGLLAAFFAEAIAP
jgi:hypothetical protein